MQNRKKRRKQSVPSSETPWLPYVEYKSQLLAITDLILPKKKDIADGANKRPGRPKRLPTASSSEKTAYDKLIKFIKNPAFFKRDQNIYSAWLTWTNQQNLYIEISFLTDKLFVVCFQKSKRKSDILVELKINIEENQVVISPFTAKTPWSLADLKDIIQDFHSLLPQAHLIYIEPSVSESAEFKSTDFDYYKDHPHFTTRLQPLQAVRKPITNKSIFWLTWGENELKVRVKSGPYFSYAFSEQELFKQFYPKEKFSQSLRYYWFKVSEKQTDQKAKKVLEFWTTLEALVLEVFQVDAGIAIKGSEALNILQKFIDLIQPQHIFLQDLANVLVPNPQSEAKTEEEKEQDGIKVPLRLSSMLTGDSTWYKKRLNVEAVNADHWQSGWNAKIYINQSTQAFYQAAKDLRSIPFNELLIYWDEHKTWLLNLASKYFPTKNTDDLIAQDILTAIFNRDNHRTAEGFYDLKILSQLLKWPYYHEEIVDLDENKVKLDLTNQTFFSSKIDNEKEITRRAECIMKTRFFGKSLPEKTITPPPQQSHKRSKITKGH